jgi:hypothetical protein
MPSIIRGVQYGVDLTNASLGAIFRYGDGMRPQQSVIDTAGVISNQAVVISGLNQLNGEYDFIDVNFASSDIGNLFPAPVNLIMPDFDGDGIMDYNDADADGDGIDNAWELANGLNPYDPSDALLDSDFDGLTNLQEFELGTDPYIRDNPAGGNNNFDVYMRLIQGIL